MHDLGIATLLRIGHTFTQPSVLVIQLYVVSTAVACFGFARVARALSLLATLLLTVFGLAPTGYWMVSSLEDRFPRPKITSHVDGVVVLGGSFDSVVSDYRRHPELNEAADRVTSLIQIAHQFPGARVVYADGGTPIDARFKEADAAAALLTLLGVDISRIAFERNAVNTRENAITALKLGRPGTGERWLLVTSARHMPRAIAAFRGVGWDIEAFPVDYMTHGGSPPLGTGNILSGLGLSNAGVKEWVGLAAYYLMGWSTEVLPSPKVSSPTPDGIQ